jgi:WD40 repeat protein
VGAARAKPTAPRGEPLSLVVQAPKVEGVAYSPDGRRLAAWCNPKTFVWDMSGGAGQAKEMARFKPWRSRAPETVTWSPDGERLALWRLSTGGVCDARTGAGFREVEEAGAHLYRLAFTSGGRLFANWLPRLPGELWTRFELRDGGDGKQVLFSAQLDVMRGDSYGISHVASVGPDDRHVYLAATHNNVYRWSPATGENVLLFGQGSRITALEVRADERLVLTAGGNTAYLWELPSAVKLVAEMKHPLICSGAALLPGGRVITSCYDGLVRVWDGSGGEMLALDLGVGKLYCLAVSPDQMTFAAGAEKRLGNKSRVVLMDVPE